MIQVIAVLMLGGLVWFWKQGAIGALLKKGMAGAGLLLALFAGNAAADQIYYVHGDHLNVPNVVTNQSRQVVWEGHRKPFGETDVAVASIRQPFRFPGQYYDGETGLHYNLMRDYDSRLGRYVQSDPIGLNGGLNTYAYSENNPLQRIDPYGLASCVYSISLHTLICRPNDSGFVGPPIGLDGSGIFSGIGSCRNNNSGECQKSKDSGPIPEGEYNMNEDTRPGHENYWRLEPNPRVSAFAYYFLGARNGFMLHPGTVSLGCITVNSNNSDLLQKYDVLDRLLDSEMGNNILTVLP